MKQMIKMVLCGTLAAIMLLTAAGCADKGGENEPEPTQSPETTKILLDKVDSFEKKMIGTANVAPLGFAISNSSHYTDDFTNLNANDGDTSTGFSSKWEENNDENREYWLFINLKESKKLSKVAIKPMKGNEASMPLEVEIQVSDDGNEYKTVGSGSFTGGDITVDITGSEGKYVRMVTKKLAKTEGKGYCYIIGEMEVYAEVLNTANMVIDKDDLWLYCNGKATTQKVSVDSFLVDNGDNVKSADFSYVSRNDNVATVSAGGLITPVAPGDTEVYVISENNISAIKVRVLEDDPYAYRTTVFYHSSFGVPEKIEKALDYIKECGIDYIEDTRWFDLYMNDISAYMLFLCAERGLFYSPNDRAGDAEFLKKSDEEIIEIVKKYENRAGFFGIYLQDEPHEEWLGYAHVANVISSYNEHITPHLNLLPPYNFDGRLTYFDDYVAVAGTANGLMRYLSYDHYLFLNAGINTLAYESINMIRKTGLKYNAATGYYIQAMEIRNAYRLPKTSELIYNASLGVAFGMKNFKYFVGLTPISSGEDFKTGIIGPDYEKSSMCEGITLANEMVKAVSKTLGVARAVEVYTTNTLSGNEKVPADFVFTRADKQNAIYTLYETYDGTQQYIVVTNNAYSGKAKSFVINVKPDISELYAVTDSASEKIEISADHTIEFTLDTGRFIVIKLPQGYDAKMSAVDRTENLALGCGVFVSSADANFWKKTNVSTAYVTDGKIDANGWIAAKDDKSPEIIVDLDKIQPVSTVEVHAIADADESVKPSSFTVFVSADGENYTEVAKVKNATTATFTTTNARYIKIVGTTSNRIGIGEIIVK